MSHTFSQMMQHDANGDVALWTQQDCCLRQEISTLLWPSIYGHLYTVIHVKNK